MAGGADFKIESNRGRPEKAEGHFLKTESSRGASKGRGVIS